MKLLSVAALAALVALPGSAATLTYAGALTDLEVAGATGSAGTGNAQVIVDTSANTMRVIVTFSGLTGTTTASHIHCCIASGAGFVVATTTPAFPTFPLGVTAGSVNVNMDLTSAGSYRSGFITAEGSIAAAEAALLAGLASGTSYLNIHTTAFPAGEIRAILAPVPEPATFVFTGMGLAAAVVARKRLKRG